MYRFIIIASLLSIPCMSSDVRVVGGEDADIENYPYQLSMEIQGLHKCGGAIIGPIWVVTAAHCVTNKTLAEIQFRAGTSIKEQGGSLHPAKQFYFHPYFILSGLQNDIAVVEVTIEFVYGKAIQPILLATEEPKPGQVASITGWGATNVEQDQFPTHLQATSLPIVDRETCDYAYQGFGGIARNMICAGQGGGRDACRDDSGGPLVVEGKLVGIVSFGQGCANEEYPGVYSNVAALRDFVISITEGS